MQGSGCRGNKEAELCRECSGAGVQGTGVQRVKGSGYREYRGCRDQVYMVQGSGLQGV